MGVRRSNHDASGTKTHGVKTLCLCKGRSNVPWPCLNTHKKKYVFFFKVPSLTLVSLTSRTSQLTRVLGLEVGLALQCRGQVIEAERQLPLEGGVLLAEGRESPERPLTHQLLDGRVATWDGVRPTWFRSLHGGRSTLGWGGGARWEGWDCRRLVWKKKWVYDHLRLLYSTNIYIQTVWALLVQEFWNIFLPFFLSGSLSSRSLLLPCWLQEELARKEPSRTNEVRLASKDAVTPHSFSLRCFLSRQAAKAQPTAWLSLSPWWSKIQRHGTQFRSHIPSTVLNVCFSTEASQCLCATRGIAVRVTFKSRFIHSQKIQRSRWRSD